MLEAPITQTSVKEPMPAERRDPETLSFPLDTIRPSDAEREEVVDRLRAHVEAGRLDADELAERLDRVYAARQRGALGAALEDMPGARPAPARAPVPARVPRSGAARGERDLGARLGGYVAVSVLLVAIWALTGAGAFWPVWFIGFGLLGVVGGGGHGMCGARRHGYRHAGVPARPGPPTIGG